VSVYAPERIRTTCGHAGDVFSAPEPEGSSRRDWLKVAPHFSVGYGATIVMPSHKHKGRSTLVTLLLPLENPRTIRFYLSSLRDASLFFFPPPPSAAADGATFIWSLRDPRRFYLDPGALNTYHAGACPYRVSKESPTKFLPRDSDPGACSQGHPSRPSQRCG
jgi:hypothetical protein